MFWSPLTLGCVPSLCPAASLHELCASRVSALLRDKVHRTDEVKEAEFYAFSYYYDLAANVGLIGKKDPVGPPGLNKHCREEDHPVWCWPRLQVPRLPELAESRQWAETGVSGRKQTAAWGMTRGTGEARDVGSAPSVPSVDGQGGVCVEEFSVARPPSDMVMPWGTPQQSVLLVPSPQH